MMQAKVTGGGPAHRSGCSTNRIPAIQNQGAAIISLYGVPFASSICGGAGSAGLQAPGPAALYLQTRHHHRRDRRRSSRGRPLSAPLRPSMGRGSEHLGSVIPSNPWRRSARHAPFSTNRASASPSWTAASSRSRFLQIRLKAAASWMSNGSCWIQPWSGSAVFGTRKIRIFHFYARKGGEALYQYLRPNRRTAARKWHDALDQAGSC